jgi:hypothetical protein
MSLCAGDLNNHLPRSRLGANRKFPGDLLTYAKLKANCQQVTVSGPANTVSKPYPRADVLSTGLKDTYCGIPTNFLAGDYHGDPDCDAGRRFSYCKHTLSTKNSDHQLMRSTGDRYPNYHQPWCWNYCGSFLPISLLSSEKNLSLEALEHC